MPSYHVSPDGPRPCKDTTGRCPYAKADKPHFDSQEEAMEYYESTMEEHFGAGSVRKTEAARQKVYAKRDQIVNSAVATKDRGVAKIQAARDRLKSEVRRHAQDVKLYSQYYSYIASEKLSQHKRQASEKKEELALNTVIASERAKEIARPKIKAAQSTAQNYGSKANSATRASARVAKKVAILAGRDVMRGVRKIDSRYQISNRAKSLSNRTKAFIAKVSRPVKKYTRNRVAVIKRIAQSEFAKPNTNHRSHHVASPKPQTETQKVLQRQKSDYFLGG